MGMRFSDRFAKSAGGFADSAARFEKQGIERDLRARLEAERLAREEAKGQTLDTFKQTMTPEFLQSDPSRAALASAFMPLAEYQAKYNDPSIAQGAKPVFDFLGGDIKAGEEQEKASTIALGKEATAGAKKTKEQTERDIKLTKNVQDKSDAYRKEFSSSPEYKLASETKTAYDQLSRLTEASAKAKTGAYDMATIFQFMKGLDPRSTVREGEFAKAENLTGPFSRMWKSYNKLKEGKMLSSEERQDMKNIVRQTYLSKLEGLGRRQQSLNIGIEDFNTRSGDERYKINREAVFGGMDYNRLKEEAAAEDEKYKKAILKSGEEIGSDPKKFAKYFDKDDVKGFVKTNSELIANKEKKLNAWYQETKGRPMNEEEKIENLRKLMVIETRKRGTFEEREPGFFEKIFN